MSKKLAFNKAESVATGGGGYKQMLLTPNEEIVAGLLMLSAKYEPAGFVAGNIPKVKTTQNAGELPNSYVLQTTRPLQNSTRSVVGDCGSVPKITATQVAGELQKEKVRSFQSSTSSVVGRGITASQFSGELPNSYMPQVYHAFQNSISSVVDQAGPAEEADSVQELENIIEEPTPNKKSRLELLQKQVNIQEKMYSKVTTSLKAIELHLKENAEARKLDIELKKKKIELLDLQIEALKKQRQLD